NQPSPWGTSPASVSTSCAWDTADLLAGVKTDRRGELILQVVGAGKGRRGDGSSGDERHRDGAEPEREAGIPRAEGVAQSHQPSEHVDGRRDEPDHEARLVEPNGGPLHL